MYIVYCTYLANITVPTVQKHDYNFNELFKTHRTMHGETYPEKSMHSQ